MLAQLCLRRARDRVLNPAGIAKVTGLTPPAGF
jgi:hypothetical protein